MAFVPLVLMVGMSLYRVCTVGCKAKFVCNVVKDPCMIVHYESFLLQVTFLLLNRPNQSARAFFVQFYFYRSQLDKSTGIGKRAANHISRSSLVGVSRSTSSTSFATTNKQSKIRIRFFEERTTFIGFLLRTKAPSVATASGKRKTLPGAC